MKTAAIKDVKAKLSEYCERSQSERVVITKHGKPVAVMVGVAGRTLEDVLTASNPDFWKMIEARRAEPTISMQELQKRVRRKSAPAKQRRSKRRR